MSFIQNKKRKKKWRMRGETLKNWVAHLVLKKSLGVLDMQYQAHT